MEDWTHYFASDYAHARDKFREAARTANAAITTFTNPKEGPEGEILQTDVAVLGDAKADRVLLLNSGVHGGEGFCGSGALVGWLRSGRYRTLPEGLKIVLVHAINPHGFAWIRRVTEDNVDLNRNFMDFAQALPENENYGDLHPHLIPGRWDADAQMGLGETFERYAAEHGVFSLQSALSRGQYAHEDGIFFGGRKPTWSNETFRRIVRDFVRGAGHVGFIDYHTGLGPYGACDLITHGAPGDPDFERVRAWYGEGVSSPEAGNSTSAALTGTIHDGLASEAGTAQITSMTAEYGTYPVPYVLTSLIGDNWLHLKSEPGSPQWTEMKARMRQTFFPDERDWMEMISLRSFQIIRRAIDGLANA
ncbi:MAG: M14 family metallopeptidase [Alphaproteobacteria bacterium]|nr:M14 family metallopeptidase [Alphaproteobacteria bacterium]